jgi:hypothetical protein
VLSTAVPLRSRVLSEQISNADSKFRNKGFSTLGARQSSLHRKQDGSRWYGVGRGPACVLEIAIGLIWSFAAMSNLVPVDGSEMSLASISRPAE